MKTRTGGDTVNAQHTLADCVRYAKDCDPLLAAAPDLLSALKQISAHCGSFSLSSPEWDYATIGNIARAAIARAQGGEK